MPIRNQTRRDPGQNIRPRNTRVAGGNIHTPNVRASRTAGLGGAMAAKGAQMASQALGKYMEERKRDNIKEGAALAMKNEALPEGATPEMAEAWYSTQGQNDGNRMQDTLTNYLLENPDTTYDEYAEFAKGHFDSSLENQPDAYAIQFGSKAIPIMEQNLRAFRVKKDTEKKVNFLTDTMVKFKDDVMQVQRFTDKDLQAPKLRELITGMQTTLKSWGFDRTDIGRETVRVIEQQALESEDTSLFEVFDVKDQDGVRLIDNATIGKAIIAAEEGVERLIEANKREAREQLRQERAENFSSTMDLIAMGNYGEAMRRMKDLSYKLDGRNRAQINELVQNEINQNRSISETNALDRELNGEIAMMVAAGDLEDYTPQEIKDLRRMKRISMQTAVNALKFLGDDSNSPQKKFFSNPEVIQIMEPPGLENILMPPVVEGVGKDKTYSCLQLYQDDVRGWLREFNEDNNRMPTTQELRDYAQKRETHWQNVGFIATNDGDSMKVFYDRILSYTSEGEPAPENLLRAFGTFMGNPDMTEDEFFDFKEQKEEFEKTWDQYVPPEKPENPEGTQASQEEGSESEGGMSKFFKRMKEGWQRNNEKYERIMNPNRDRLMPTPEEKADNPFSVYRQTPDMRNGNQGIREVFLDANKTARDWIMDLNMTLRDDALDLNEAVRKGMFHKLRDAVDSILFPSKEFSPFQKWNTDIRDAFWGYLEDIRSAGAGALDKGVKYTWRSADDFISDLYEAFKQYDFVQMEDTILTDEEEN